MTFEIVSTKKIVSNPVETNLHMIMICLFALSCYTCFIICITYLVVLINIPKSQDFVKNNIEEENNVVVDEEFIPSAPSIDTVVATAEIFDRNHYINELIRIEKKIAFYDIRQHHYSVDVTRISKFHLFGGGCDIVDETLRFKEDKRMILLEYISRLDSIDSSIFEKKADDLLLFTYFRIRQDLDVGNIHDYRMRNIGYIIDTKFIENLVLHTQCLSPSDKSEQRHINNYEVELMEFANNLHNVFYKKLKEEYRKIEYKYTSIPYDFAEFDKLMNEVHDNEMEILSLDEYDLKRRKLAIRGLKLWFDNHKFI